MSITWSSDTFRDGAECDGADYPDRIAEDDILLLAHSPAIRAVSADSGNNLLSNNARSNVA